MTDPFTEAYEAVDNVSGIVRNRLDDAVAWAETARTSAQEALNELAEFAPKLAFDSVPAPTPPVLSSGIGGNLNLPELGTTSFGTVSDAVTPAPALSAIDMSGIEVDILPFMPSITSLAVPEAPAATAPETPPERPETGEVTIPGAPTVTKPNFPALDAINIPTFVFPTLPVFDAQAPEFEGSPVSTVLQWRSEEYVPELLDEVAEKLRAMWSGGTGLPEAVEQAMFERAAGREDLVIARDIAAATTEFSSRGFTMPPGMLVARIDAIREDGASKKLGLNREITIKVAEWQIENLRHATVQGIAASQVFTSIWDSIAQREFEAAKIHLDSQLALYNAQVALFNARMSAYGTEAEVYKARLQGELARIEVFKAELEGELARGTLNEQRVRIYGEQIKALLTDIEVYKAQMQGAGVQADVIKTRIEGYRADVQAYAERVQADKVRYDAYDSRVRGESAKAGMMEAESRAYAAYVQGKATVADVGIKQLQVRLDTNRLLIQQHASQLDVDKARMQAQVAVVDANARAHSANTQRFTASVGAEEARFRLDLSAKEAEMRTSLSLYEIEIRKHIAGMEQLIRKAQLQLNAITAAGQAASTLAAGAMAGVSVGASISGSGGVSASGGYSVSRSNNNSVSYSYGGDVSADVSPKTST